MLTLAAMLLLNAGFQEEKPKGPETKQEARPQEPDVKPGEGKQEPKPEVQEPKPELEKVPATLAQEEPVGLFVEGRAGVWIHPGFEASTPMGLRRIKGEAMGEGGLDLGYRLSGWAVRVSFDYASANDVVLWAAGLHVGPTEPVLEGPAGPIVVGLSGGILLGGLDVNLPQFGSFSTGIGFQARAEVSTLLTPTLDVSLWADFRYLPLRYQEPTLSGDSSAIGSGAAFGLSLTFQF
jgi:hypothetical protein